MQIFHKVGNRVAFVTGEIPERNIIIDEQEIINLGLGE